MDTSTTSIDGGPKKVPLEDLTKEELVKKCRNLLAIAQKAKQARDAIVEENNKLKNAASEEIIVSLTEQKLSLVTTVDELQRFKNSAEEHISELKQQLAEYEVKTTNLDTENQGYKRQVNRLTEENEQLLTHLDGLEMQIDELKKIGLEQQQQLLILEQNNEVLTKNVQASEQVDELQKMLSVSLGEVKKLKEENDQMHTMMLEKDAKIASFQADGGTYDQHISQLEEYREQLKLKDQEIAKQTAITDDLNTELHRNRALADKLKQDISTTNKKFNDNQIESSGINAELQNVNEKMRDKLKVYHGKIVRLAGDVKRIKESKEYILETFKLYNQQVTLWKDQLTQLSSHLRSELQKNNEEKSELEEKIQFLESKLRVNSESKLDEIKLLKDQHDIDLNNIEKLSEQLKEHVGIKEENVQLHETINKMREQIASLEAAPVVTTELNDISRDLSSKCEEVSRLQEELSGEKAKLESIQEELSNLQGTNASLVQQITDLQLDNKTIDKELSELKLQLTSKQEVIDKNFEIHEDELKQLRDALESEKTQWKCEEKTLKEQINQLEATAINEKSQNTQLEATIEGNTRLISELKKAIEKLELDAACIRESESHISEQSSEAILQLRQENKALQDKIDELERQLEPFLEQPADVTTLKRENAELLAEMNVMNQALKERGETISQQQSHCDEMLKKIQVYEGQLAKSQENVQMLQDEVTALRAQLSHESPEDDTLSTSTISRADEVNRMKELEGSWEERYGKLRNYALKLKAKVKLLQEQLDNADSSPVEELQARLATNVKTVQSMQGELDALQDKLDASKEDKRRLEQATKDNQRLLVEMSKNEDAICKLRAQVDTLTQEKSSVDAWKKQVGTKVQALKKELEANALMRKDFEGRLTKMQGDLDAKCKELQAEKDKHQSTRSQLQESNNECKKQSVLNLEIQDYERSIKELTAKLEKKNEQVTKLKNQIDAQKSSVNSTKETNRLLEEKTNELETELQACRIEIKAFKKQIADLEITIGDKENKIEEVTNQLEATRSENEDLSTQLSKIVSDHQKANNLLREEKDHFRNENVDLEQRLRALEDTLKLRNDELVNITSEYQSYKVRAQSVLRQNQNRDVGLEEKLAEEAATLRAQIQISAGEISELKSHIEQLESANEKLILERSEWEAKRQEIQLEHENTLQEVDKLNAKQQQLVQEHSETVRSLKLHTETLSQCYRQQISEQEVRHNREIIELQSKYDKNALLAQPEIPSLLIPSSIREEGEGSESVESNNGNTIHPLEKLLGSDQDQELAAMKKQLTENELRVVHLTALLADTEQDLAKHVQMNKVLKEEIRRQQRSVERERHAENLEYMKNVVFKFITLSSGDERLRLVPVLNTILKLSPEETNKLNMVAKGDKSWSNYLPLWSSATGSKPQ